MSKPLLFISHKHSDKDIASAFSAFLQERTLGNIDIFQSSNYDFDGPRFGANLNSELKSALWKCDTLVLIYTSIDNDWSYCMYECGVATHPNSPDTKIIVLQCGQDVPSLFKDKLRVNARSQPDIKKFTKELLTSSDFFPSLNQALAANVSNDTIENAANELYENIGKTLPEPINNIEEWPAWPFLRIELPQSEVAKISATPSAERLQLAIEVIMEQGIIIQNDSRIAQIFGMASLPERGKFANLLNIWVEHNPDESPIWFESCCDQIMIGARREFPVIKNVSVKEINGSLEYTPVLSRVKSLAFAGTSQFDFYFYNLNDPRAVRVANKMITLENMFYRRIGNVSPESIKIKELVNELNQTGRNRVPFFTDDQLPLYMIHRSMIDKFVAKKMWSDTPIPLDDLTLKHLLEDEELKEIFEKTFVLVSRNTSLYDAQIAMLARPNCSDIFITENGNKQEPVIGWLTNKDIAMVK